MKKVTRNGAGHARRHVLTSLCRFALGTLWIALLGSASIFAQTPPSPPPSQDTRGIGLDTSTSKTATNKAAATTANRPELVLQTGHVMKVDGIAFSPDDRLLATGSADNTVKLWDVATERELRNLTGHALWVKAVAFSPDGLLLASGSVDGNVKIWDVVSGREVRNLSGCGSVNTVAFSPDGQMLAVGNMEKLIKIWEVATGREVRTLTGHTGWVLSVAFSPNGKWLASGSRDNTVKIWDVSTGQEARALAGHTDRIKSVAFSPDGKRLASGSFDTTVKLWEVSSGKEVRTFTGHTSKIIGVAFSPDGRSLTAVAADKRAVKVWEVSSGKEVRTLSDPESLDSIESVGFNHDATWLASSNGDKTIGLRELKTRGAQRVLASRSSGVYANAFSPDGKWFASGSKDNTVRIWEAATGLEVRNMEGNIGWITSVSFSPDGRLLATGGLSGTIKLWEVATGLEVRSLKGHTDSVNAVAFSADGKLASASNDKTIKIWEAEAGRELSTLNGHSNEVHSVAFSTDGKWLVSGSADNSVKIWDVATGREARTMTGHSGGVYGVAFSPDGQFVASGSYDKTVKLWEAATGREVRSMPGTFGYTTAAFSPDGRLLVTGSLSGAVKMWEVASGREVRSLASHSGSINGLAFSPSGKWFSSGSEDGSTRVWDAETGDLLATLVSLRDSTDWLVVAPDGLFDGSPAAWNQILWRFERNTYNARPVEVFFNEYYYPGLLGQILAGKRPKAAQDIALRDRRQPQVKLMLANEQAPEGSLTTREVAVKIEVAEAPADKNNPTGSGVQDVRLFRNGSLVRVWRGDVLQGKGGKVVLETTFPVVAGDNNLTAYAFNRDNVKSTDAALSLIGADSLKRQGTAYILAIGVNKYANKQFDLKYAVADAQVFGEELERAQTKINSYGRIEIVPLYNNEATRANILLALKRLSGGEAGPLPPGAPAALEKLKPVQPEDTLVIYFAGHGMVQKQRFYMLPHDIGYMGERGKIDQAAIETMASHSVSDRELELALEKVDAGQLLMVLDACHSGAALESEENRRGPMNAKGLAQLAYEKGMFILTAAQSYQAAQEVSQLGHGLLTYALVVQGLKEGAADKRPKDSRVVMGEWLDYATDRVPQMQLERMKRARGLGAELAFVEGEEKSKKLENRNLQRPRVFYRRELEARPLIVTRVETAQLGNK